MAGDPDIKDKLLKGYTFGDMTYKVHLDGFNLVPYLTGEVEKSPRERLVAEFCDLLLERLGSRRMSHMVVAAPMSSSSEVEDDRFRSRCCRR